MNVRIRLAISTAALAATIGLSGCGTEGGDCATNLECTNAGEICLPAGFCGCDVGLAEDACTAADATKACHPDSSVCVKTCANDTECTVAGEKCDLQVHVCRDASNVPDCTQAGGECASAKACDPATKACIDRCTATSCGAGKACNDFTGLCENDCAISGNECTGGSVCDDHVCKPTCGTTGNICGEDESCGGDGLCIRSCDAATNPTTCGANSVCDTGTGLCIGYCETTTPSPCTSAEYCDTTTHKCAAKCTSDNDCESGAKFCDLVSGTCEARIDIEDCAAPTTATNRTYPKEASNTCEPVSELATCADAARRDGGNPEEAAGPTAFFSEFKGYQSVNDAQCQGTRGTLHVAYYDYQGDFPQSGTSLNISTRIALLSTGEDDGYTNTIPPQLTTGSTGTTGLVEFTLCRAAATDARTFAIYLRDSNGHFGNTMCVEFPAP